MNHHRLIWRHRRLIDHQLILFFGFSLTFRRSTGKEDPVRACRTVIRSLSRFDHESLFFFSDRVICSPLIRTNETKVFWVHLIAITGSFRTITSCVGVRFELFKTLLHICLSLLDVKYELKIGIDRYTSNLWSLGRFVIRHLEFKRFDNVSLRDDDRPRNRPLLLHDLRSSFCA
jgi:hypothetical protein